MNISTIAHYFPGLTDRQYDQFSMLENLYQDWNEKINVISRKDVANIEVHHVLHSLGIAKVCSFTPGTSILDVGTGGGFPGIPLAILFPEVQFHLVDSIGKKIKVVNGVSEVLGLKNVRGQQIRAEEIRVKYDFIVSRAVTRLKPFYGWVKNSVSSISKNSTANGILYLKGGDLQEEIDELSKPSSIFSLSDYFAEEFFLTKKVVHVPF